MQSPQGLKVSHGYYVCILGKTVFIAGKPVIKTGFPCLFPVLTRTELQFIKLRTFLQTKPLTPVKLIQYNRAHNFTRLRIRI